MGIIAWIILGLLAGFVAKAILPGDDPGGVIITTLIGVAGAFIGGFIAKALGFGDPIDEFFDFSTRRHHRLDRAAAHLPSARGRNRSKANGVLTRRLRRRIPDSEPGPPGSDNQRAVAMLRACVSACKKRRARLDSECVADLGWD
jgi:uncharacterized membrane protein YeaQ/YmgE (transglycosylase-associated protein family)